MLTHVLAGRVAMKKSDVKGLHRRDLLAQYLLEVLPGVEIARFVGDTFGAEIEDEIPRSASRAALVDDVVDVLERRGLLGEAFFVELTRLAPGLTDRVLALARQWCDPSAVDAFVRTRSSPEFQCLAAADAMVARVDVSHRVAKECLGWRMGEGGAIRCSDSAQLTDLSLDITVMSRLEDALVISGLGLYVEEISHRERARPAAGVAFGPVDFVPRKLAVFDAVRISTGRYSDLQWRTIYDWAEAHQAIERAFVEEFEDPVFLPSQSAVRFKLGVDGLFMSHEVVVRARIIVATQRGLIRTQVFSLES